MFKYMISLMTGLFMLTAPAFASTSVEEGKPVCPNKTVVEQLQIGMDLLKSKNISVVSTKSYNDEEAHDLMHKIRDVLKFRGIPEDSSYDAAGVVQVESGYLVFLGKGVCFHSSGMIPNAGWKLMFGSDA